MKQTLYFYRGTKTPRRITRLTRYLRFFLQRTERLHRRRTPVRRGSRNSLPRIIWEIYPGPEEALV